ncbi:transcriptional regulator BetI [Aquamicrobium defluvii]|uniref:HTH-type transcriptional regulator BetI n=1 Tax=Aquamicrobium defluvii TaxID=69279 RepID=A0A011TEK2_9HYPH|nr:transcriptional regulator BetI [Aquamicrobium defluvii]EXL10099.1 BetI family transcriptional regulator [Aquamicrobium defluvii]EZQ16875.1 BetI family transcriptional regulator [Halopseudomonas bauzanensis]TDR36422.1 TetR family transcriptional regulator [Aquamicrobium defluvii]
MPKIGMEPVRRKALIDATISTIGERGTLNVTVAEIAGRAGVSSALAHHYFGPKEELLQATMRQLLADLGRDAVSALRSAATPRERVSAVISVNFNAGQFREETVHAWLAFYVEAQNSPTLRRLLRVYARRLHSNLMSGLAPLVPRPEAERAAEAIAAMIDGLYIRRALRDGLPNPASATALVEDYVDAKLRQQANTP